MSTKKEGALGMTLGQFIGLLSGVARQHGQSIELIVAHDGDDEGAWLCVEYVPETQTTKHCVRLSINNAPKPGVPKA